MSEAFENRIETVTTTLKGKNNANITTFSTLTFAINNSGYKPTTKGEAIKYANFLTDCFLELIEMYPRHLGDVTAEIRQSLRKKDLILEPLMFFGYVSAFTKMYEQKILNWRGLIHKLNKNIKIGAFNGRIVEKEAPVWEQVFKQKNEQRLIINNNSTRKYVSDTLTNYLLGIGNDWNEKPIENRAGER